MKGEAEQEGDIREDSSVFILRFSSEKKYSIFVTKRYLYLMPSSKNPCMSDM